MSQVGFEYKNKKNETPFETFLRYTDEKEKSAAKLASILEEKMRGSMRILDIGTGNGEYLRLALSQLPTATENMELTLVEPSEDLASQLKGRFKDVVQGNKLTVAVSDLQGFKSDGTFDVVLMSHLFYHVSRATWADQLSRALSLLKPGGILVIVLREKDDAYDFKMAFKPQLFDNPSFKALTLDDVLDVLPRDGSIRITKRLSESALQLPMKESREDTISIIEFYLNKEWDEIPPELQQAAFGFIEEKGSRFKQLDGIAVVEKAA